MNKLNIFKLGDFEDVNHREDAHKKANGLLNKFIEDNGVKVFGPSSTNGPANWNEQPGKFDTHSAILINIQPIEKPKCEHEPKYTGSHRGMLYKNVCNKCGLELKAEWKVAE